MISAMWKTRTELRNSYRYIFKHVVFLGSAILTTYEDTNPHTPIGLPVFNGGAQTGWCISIAKMIRNSKWAGTHFYILI